MSTHSFQIHLDHMMKKVDALIPFPCFRDKTLAFRFHACKMLMSGIESTTKEIDAQLAQEIRNRTEEHLALHYEGLVKDNDNQLKHKFFETFEFYKNIYNCEEKMLEWKKLKYDLKRYKKFETLYNKLKKMDFKGYEEKFNKERERKRGIV